MYISTKEAAKRFGISDRRVQKLCESGRIPGAQMISGVWLIPSSAKKPIDERYTQISIFDFEDKGISLSELCKELSISLATGRNWIRLGKLIPSSTEGNTPFFTEDYVKSLKSDLADGKNAALKSRRNKKYISGNGLYKDYVSTTSKAINTVQEILDLINENQIVLTDCVISYLLAECATQLLGQRFFEKTIHLIDYLNDPQSLDIFSELISDITDDTNQALLFISHNSNLFQLIYTYEDNEDILGLLYISLNNIGERKAKGSYFTPTRVVKNLICNLQEMQSLNEKDILDPCCGTGNFLLQLPSNLNVSNIFGGDIDEVSIKLTRINMALKFKQFDISLLKEHFYVKDFLFVDDNKQFDIIVGNPPWGFDFSEDAKNLLREKYVSADGKNVESYDVFIEQSLRILHNNGVLSFVLPEAVLNVKSHALLREVLLQKTSIQYLEIMGNVFDNVQCPSIILQIANTNQHLDTQGMVVNDGNRKYTISLSREVSPEYFSFMTTDEEYSIIQKLDMLSNKTTLKGNGIFALGIVTGNNKEYISNIRSDNNEMVLKGSDIYKYRFKPTDNYISFLPELFQQVAPVEYYRAKEKLLYRFICNQLVFAYDDKQTLSLNSCNILIPTFINLNIKYVLAVLNSSIAQFYFKKQFNSVKVLRSHIEQIPIPVITQKEQNNIIELVTTLSNEEDTEIIQKIYYEIDTILAKLYGLDNDELEYIQAQNESNLFLF